VGGRIGAVKAHTDPPNPRVFDPTCNISVNKRSIGCQRNDQTSVTGVASDVKNVWTEQWLAPREYKYRSRKGGYLVYQIKRLFRREVLRQELVGHRDASAVDAGQIAASGRLPEDQTWGRISGQRRLGMHRTLLQLNKSSKGKILRLGSAHQREPDSGRV
jgi:hypothetical protein